jgi:hypothetical protein
MAPHLPDHRPARSLFQFLCFDRPTLPESPAAESSGTNAVGAAIPGRADLCPGALHRARDLFRERVPLAARRLIEFTSPVNRPRRVPKLAPPRAGGIDPALLLAQISARILREITQRFNPLSCKSFGFNPPARQILASHVPLPPSGTFYDHVRGPSRKFTPLNKHRALPMQLVMNATAP